MKIDKQANKLYFATSPKKEVYQELLIKPHIELLDYHGNISIRIKGKAIFNVPDNICREIYTNNPVLSRLYAQYTDLVYFNISIDEIDYFDLAPTPPISERFEF